MKASAMTWISILLLVVFVKSGSGSPVAGEGDGAGGALDFMSAIAETAMGYAGVYQPAMEDVISVEGEVGPGRYFYSDTVEFQGDVADVAESSVCCSASGCLQHWPTSNIFTFSSRQNRCHCYAPVPGKTPKTRRSSYLFAGVCQAVVIPTEEKTETPAV